MKFEKCETSKIKEVNQHSLLKERQVTLSSKVLLFSLYLVDFENMHEKNFYTYAMLNPNKILYTFLRENNVVFTCLAMLYSII